MKYLTIATVLLLATVAAAEDNRKWYAMAYPIGGLSSYGVAWNFSTKAAAESAAVGECEKRARSRCEVDRSDHDHCFMILRGKTLTQTWFRFFVRDPLRLASEQILFQAEEEARRVAAEVVRSLSKHGRKYGLEMVACSGDPRNRRATR